MEFPKTIFGWSHMTINGPHLIDMMVASWQYIFIPRKLGMRERALRGQPDAVSNQMLSLHFEDKHPKRHVSFSCGLHIKDEFEIY